ncbi:MAG: class I adenylate-forming enzyme family protein [Candidatus Sumerlaeota bacterium]|nr:class I adenylate-forming enzyme family protein [Candidatus Sumerlaeota bacterium]
MNLADLFHQAAKQWLDKDAIVQGADCFTYRRLGEWIETLKSGLQQAGVRPGQRIGLFCGDSAAQVAASFAIMAAGAAVAPISPALSKEERRAIIEQVHLNGVVSEGGGQGGRGGLSGRGGPGRLLEGGVLFQLNKSDVRPPEGFSQINAAFVRFTSGTTGESKGVVLSHETIHDRIAAANAALRIGPADTILWTLPMAYHFAVSIVCYLLNGATILLCETADAKAMLEMIRQRKATVLYAAPQHYRRFIENAAPGAREISRHVRLAISTSAGLPRETAETFCERFGVALSNCYGLIEAGLPFINLEKPLEKCDSVGRATPGYEARLARADGTECLRNETGEIWLRGPGFLDAYYSPWRQRSEIMSGGWFHTGDLGQMDEEGFLRLAGRAHEVINCGGVKLFPTEIERVLDAHPAVAESQVYGAPDADLGEIPAARVVLKKIATTPSADELIRYCRAHLSADETPRRIEFISALPRTASGKLKRT